MTILLTEYDLTADHLEAALDGAFTKVYASRIITHRPDSFDVGRKGLHDDSIKHLAGQGMSATEVARRLDMSLSGVHLAAKRLGVTFADGRRKRTSQAVAK